MTKGPVKYELFLILICFFFKESWFGPIDCVVGGQLILKNYLICVANPRFDSKGRK